MIDLIDDIESAAHGCAGLRAGDLDRFGQAAPMVNREHSQTGADAGAGSPVQKPSACRHGRGRWLVRGCWPDFALLRWVGHIGPYQVR